MPHMCEKKPNDLESVTQTVKNADPVRPRSFVYAREQLSRSISHTPTIEKLAGKGFG